MHITSNCLVLITMITNLCSPGIFTVEMCAKIFAMGFICHENSYLRYFQCMTYSIRIVVHGKLQLVLMLAIMSLGHVKRYYLILNVHKPCQFQITLNTFTSTRMGIGKSICKPINIDIFKAIAILLKIILLIYSAVISIISINIMWT